MIEAILVIFVILAVFGMIAVGRSVRVVQQFEQGIVFRFGRIQSQPRGAGLTMIRPVGDRMQKVNMQIIAMAVPAQDGITRDNVTVRVDAVVYFRVVDPIKATVNVQNYLFAVSQQAQTSLRSIITADGEYQASKRLAAAANVMARDPAALQLRLLQTVVEVAGEKNSTLVMPVPVELLRFFEKMAPGPAHPEHEPPAEIDDLGDAEVAAAEAAISSVHVPELEESSIPPVPEVEGAVAPEVREVAAPDLAAPDLAGKDKA